MAELDRPDAGNLLVLADRRLGGEHLAHRSLAVLERQHPGDAGTWIVARLAAQALGLDAAADVVELGVGRDLERQSRAARMVALLELDREIAQLGREEGAAVFPLRQCESGDLGEIVDLPVELGRLERRVADPLDVDHRALRSFDRASDLRDEPASRGMPGHRGVQCSFFPWLPRPDVQGRARRACPAARVRVRRRRTHSADNRWERSRMLSGGVLDRCRRRRCGRLAGKHDVVGVSENENLRCAPDDPFQVHHGPHPQPELPQQQVLNEVAGQCPRPRTAAAVADRVKAEPAQLEDEDIGAEEIVAPILEERGNAPVVLLALTMIQRAGERIAAARRA